MTGIQYGKKLAEEYSSEGRHEHPIGQMNYETWLEEVGMVEGITVLDLACGSGHTSRLLAARGAHVVGVDISSEMIRLAREAEEREPLDITYIVADASALDIGRTFELVTPTYLFNYAKDRATLDALVRGATTHLSKGGRMVALNASTDPIVPRLPNGQHESYWQAGETPGHDGARAAFVIYDLAGAPISSPIEFVHWSKDTYQEAFEAAGLVDAHWVPIRPNTALMRMFPNWPALAARNISTVITARKG